MDYNKPDFVIQLEEKPDRFDVSLQLTITKMCDMSTVYKTVRTK